MYIKLFQRLVSIAMVTAAFLFSTPVFAIEIPSVIKVGLESKYKNVDSVSFSNAALRAGDGVINGTALRAVASTAYFVELGSGYSSFADASEHAAYLGHSAAVAFRASGLAVYSGPYDTQAEAGANALAGTVIAASPRVIVYDGSSPVAILENGIRLSDANGGAISLGERSYRGAIELAVSGSRLTAINVLTLDEYLYSAVPSEMPSAWPLEALKAQSVAARTYAVTRMTAHNNEGYNFCDRVHCQNYVGAGNEAESVIAAVNATSGVFAYYNGEPINAVYSSSSGGYTEDSENTWTEVVPYLRSVEDMFETTGMIWERTYTLNQIQSLLQENIGTVTGVYIGRTSVSGRVQELVIQGTSGSKTLTKEAIRTFFSSTAEGTLQSRNFSMQGASATGAPTSLSVAGLRDAGSFTVGELYAVSASGEILKLPSEVSAVGRNESAVYKSSSSIMSGGGSQGNTAVFTGRGWGHGVGMSQHGARGMAEAGFDYIQILKHYYTGIEVQ